MLTVCLTFVLELVEMQGCHIICILYTCSRGIPELTTTTKKQKFLKYSQTFANTNHLCASGGLYSFCLIFFFFFLAILTLFLSHEVVKKHTLKILNTDF